jgi:hypothetical protein
MDRRNFLTGASTGTIVGAISGAQVNPLPASEEPAPATISFGVVTDVHYATIPPRGLRRYDQSLQKLQQAVNTFRKRELAFIIELGDVIDADPEKLHDAEYLRAARTAFEQFPGPRYYALGNHCVWILGKPAFLNGCGMERSWYSFESGLYHGVVLDACFCKDESPYQPGEFDWKDSWIPGDELKWLADDLARAKGRTVLVFVHQNLHDETRPCGIKNASEVRRVLEKAGNVMAVFQGHEHSGAYAKIGGIHYVTMRGLIEGSELESTAYGIVTVSDGGRMRIEGFGKQPNLMLE